MRLVMAPQRTLQNIFNAGLQVPSIIRKPSSRMWTLVVPVTRFSQTMLTPKSGGGDAMNMIVSRESSPKIGTGA
jgi:hypothetical protein